MTTQNWPWSDTRPALSLSTYMQASQSRQVVRIWSRYVTVPDLAVSDQDRCTVYVPEPFKGAASDDVAVTAAAINRQLTNTQVE